MIVAPQEVNKFISLINNLEAYDAFLALLTKLHDECYISLRDSIDQIDTFRHQGKLQLIDELKEFRERLKDSIDNGRLNAATFL